MDLVNNQRCLYYDVACNSADYFPKPAKRKAMQKALVVEDNPTVATVMASYLRRVIPTIAVHQAPSLKDARACLTHIRPDIVLLDIGLPDGRGTQLLTEACLPSESLVIVTTVFADDEYVFEALRAGARGYLLKDESDEEFIRAFEGILAGRPALSPAIARRIIDFFRPQTADKILSPRETELLSLIAQGHSVRRAAEALGLTQNTAAGYLKNIYQKLQVNCRAAVTRKAIDLGLVKPF
jgi:DNA-binding NarL/FixJ family response regulator